MENDVDPHEFVPSNAGTVLIFAPENEDNEVELKLYDASGEHDFELSREIQLWSAEALGAGTVNSKSGINNNSKALKQAIFKYFNLTKVMSFISDPQILRGTWIARPNSTQRR